jgi:hypothetical protein
VSFASITLCVVSQRVFFIIIVYFVTYLVRKLEVKSPQDCNLSLCGRLRHADNRLLIPMPVYRMKKAKVVPVRN